MCGMSALERDVEELCLYPSYAYNVFIDKNETGSLYNGSG